MSGFEMTFEVLEDGTIKATTGKVGAESHQAAEGFLAQIAKDAGGATKRTPRGDHAHGHHHHTHDHHHEH